MQADKTFLLGQMFLIVYQTFPHGGWNIPWQVIQYHNFLCAGWLWRLDICTPDTEYLKCVLFCYANITDLQ